MLTLRSNTTDAQVFSEVCLDNVYRIPDRMDGMRVLDVGAHIGCFTHACLYRGTAAIYAFESDPGNCQRLNWHFGDVVGVQIHQAAVWRSDDLAGTLLVGSYPLAHNPAANGVFAGGTKFLAIAQSLDGIIHAYGPFDLLKLDCECSEYPIVFTSQRLVEIPAICGEWHTGVGDANGIFGLGDWTPQHLRQHLRDLGYTCEFMFQRDFTHQGMFWAWKGPCPFKKLRAGVGRHAAIKGKP